MHAFKDSMWRKILKNFGFLSGSKQSLRQSDRWSSTAQVFLGQVNWIDQKLSYNNLSSSSSLTPTYLNARKFDRCGKKNVSKCAWKLRRRRTADVSGVVQRRRILISGRTANNSSDSTRSREAWCDREWIHIRLQYEGIWNNIRRLQIMSKRTIRIRSERDRERDRESNMKWDPVRRACM